MRHLRILAIISLTLLVFSCKKDRHPDPPRPPDPVRKVLLKDITIPNLPSPYYHFKYRSDSLPSKVDFDSGLSMYDILYNDKNKIAEMRSNIIVNHDTLRYLYDDKGKVFLIKFINESNVTYRHATFTYDGDLVKEIQWDHAEGTVGYLIDRTLTFTYYADGNVKTITENRPDFVNPPGTTSVTLFENYDNKINVDDFSLIHDGIHDHLFLLQGFRLQRNNPGKVTFTGGPGLVSYKVDYTYIYNSDNTPSQQNGDLVFTAGSQTGQKFKTNTFYTYY